MIVHSFIFLRVTFPGYCLSGNIVLSPQKLSARENEADLAMSVLEMHILRGPPGKLLVQSTLVALWKRNLDVLEIPQELL